MFNFLVSSRADDWNGAPWVIERNRCVNEYEYTAKELTEQFGALDMAALASLRRLPCIFAYESFCQQNPKFGRLRSVVQQGDNLVIDYEIVPIEPFVTYQQLGLMVGTFQLGRLEMSRTHWALKFGDLFHSLGKLGVVLPPWAFNAGPIIDISKHDFDVALSFPGGARNLVQPLATELRNRMGVHRCFYDDHYQAQLGQPNLDLLLQDVYRRAKLIVVFVGAAYQERMWCGVEFRAIREILASRESGRIMPVRTDDGAVEGILPIDGYIDIRRFDINTLAGFIEERVAILAM